MELKGDNERTPQPTKTRAYWISQETWRLSKIRMSLQRANREIAREVIQTWHRNDHESGSEAGDIESYLVVVHKGNREAGPTVDGPIQPE